MHVFTTNVDGPGNLDVRTDVSVILDGVCVRYFPTGPGRRLFRSPAMAEALCAEIATFDVVHIHYVWVWTTTAAARAAREKGIPYILAPRGMLVKELVMRKSRIVKSLWLRLFERRNVAEAAAIHVTSKSEARKLAAMALASQRVVVLANGVDVQTTARRPIAREGHKRPFVLFIGRLSWEKGLDRLIPAMVGIPDLDLVIAGDGKAAYRAWLEELANASGIPGRVHFLGSVDDEQKAKLLALCSMLVLSSYSENFGVVVAEAMAAACPVIVAQEVGMAAAVRAGGAGLVVDGSAGSFSAAIRSLADDPAQARQMGEAGRAYARRHFAWSAIAEQAELLYQQCISRQK